MVRGPNFVARQFGYRVIWLLFLLRYQSFRLGRADPPFTQITRRNKNHIARSEQNPDELRQERNIYHTVWILCF